MPEKARECKHYDSCSAPLCPLKMGALLDGVWYADEEICRLREFQGLKWVQNQRKIKRLGGVEGYFTFEMLDREIVVRRGIHGIDPDRKDEAEQIKRWLARFERKKELVPS